MTTSSSTLTVGLIGLGFVGQNKLGGPLTNAGIQVLGWDISPAACAKAASLGIRIAGSGREVAKQADIILLSLRTWDDVRTALYGEDGLVHTCRADTIIVDTSTTLPHETCANAAKLAEYKVHLVDAPVSFGDKGTTFFLGAAEGGVFDALKPVLGPIAFKLAWCGGIGQGNVFKLAQNLINAGYYAAISEAFAFMSKCGGDPERLFAAIHDTGSASRLLNRIPGHVLNRSFAQATGTISIHCKDIKYICESAAHAGAFIPFTSQVRQIFNWAAATKGPNWSQFIIINWWEHMNGVEVRPLSAGEHA